MNEKRILLYFLQSLLGLKCLHDHRIIHRDIKPANLFLSQDQRVLKIGDLNVSKVIKNDLAQTQIGTPYYLAPEVWNNEQYDFKVDVFSLGCVLYEMTCLKPPFKGDSLSELYQSIQKGVFKPIPNKYSRDLQSMIEMMLKVNPNERISL